MQRLLSKSIVAALFSLAAVPWSTSTHAADNGFITIIWGRSNWQATQANKGKCVVVPGARTLQQNADDLLKFKDGRGRPLRGVGGVVVNRTAETGHPCFRGYTTQASWADMNVLKNAPYNWTFISQGMNYRNLNPPIEPGTPDITDEEIIEESLDTLPLLYSRGHTRAWGAFNYPNNKQDARAQRIVTREFAFGRRYAQVINRKSAVTSFPYTMHTLSVTGGRCFARGLPCSNFPIKNERVTISVDHVANLLSPGPDQWGVVQFYRLVEGKRGAIGDGLSWDCTDPRWERRWTSQPEIYCRESFLDALRKRRGSAEYADPATVAQRWGVTVPRD